MRQSPKHLKKSGKDFCLKVQKNYIIETEHCHKRLELACECLDVMDSARQTIEKEGEYYQDRFNQPKAHPAFAIIKDQKTLFIRIIRELGLDLIDPEESRPPRGY